MRRRRGKNRQQNKGGAPAWMVTYSDMVTLILVFFVLLFSMSQIDMIKFEALSQSFRERVIFDFMPSAIPMESPSERMNHAESTKQSNDFKSFAGDSDRDEEDSLSRLIVNVETFLEEHDLTDVISANRTERGVVLVLQESVLFDTGEAEILNSGKPFLKKIGELLTEIPNHVKIEGHTDSRPINSYRYPSNWELSGARASSVIRYLLDENDLDASRFSLAGYGDTRPVKPNDTLENMQENRRVEIVILNEEYEGDE